MLLELNDNKLNENEEAFFISSFEECLKYLHKPTKIKRNKNGITFKKRCGKRNF
jgi:hypothetical protein